MISCWFNFDKYSYFNLKLLNVHDLHLPYVDIVDFKQYKTKKHDKQYSKASQVARFFLQQTILFGVNFCSTFSYLKYLHFT